MKKNLLVLLVVGLMVALLGAPAFAAGHEGGHVDPETFVVIAADAVSADQGSITLFAGATAEDIEEDLASGDIVFAQGPAEGNQFNILGACEFLGAPDPVTSRLGFTVEASGLDGTTPYALSGDEMLYPLTASDDAFYSLRAAADPKIVIEDGSWADLSDTPGEVSATVGFVKEVAASTSDSGSGGCDLLAIAPMAGLLVLPLMLLVRR